MKQWNFASSSCQTMVSITYQKVVMKTMSLLLSQSAGMRGTPADTHCKGQCWSLKMSWHSLSIKRIPLEPCILPWLWLDKILPKKKLYEKRCTIEGARSEAYIWGMNYLQVILEVAWWAWSRGTARVSCLGLPSHWYICLHIIIRLWGFQEWGHLTQSWTWNCKRIDMHTLENQCKYLGTWETSSRSLLHLLECLLNLPNISSCLFTRANEEIPTDSYVHWDFTWHLLPPIVT